MKVYGCYTNTTPEFTRPPLENVSRSVKCSGGGIMEEELIFVGGIGEKDRAGDGKKLSRNYAQGARVYSEEGIATALSAQPVGSYGGTTSLYLTNTMQEPISCASRGRPSSKGTNKQQIELNGTNANSITTVQKDSMVCEPPKDEKKYRIRALTERECFRLMGVKEEDYQKIASHQSRSSQTHLAGDSIVTTSLMAIFGEMFENVDYRQRIEEVAEAVREGETMKKCVAPKLTFRLITTAEERATAKDLVETYHSYVPSYRSVGRRIDWLIYANGELVGMIGIGSATYPPCKDLLKRLGISKQECAKIFNSIANNWRFCMIKRIPNAGTKILKFLRQNAPIAWKAKYGDELKYLMTFVGGGNNGAVYKADNWEVIGYTAGLPHHKACSMKWNTSDELRNRFVKPNGENRKIILFKEL